MVRFVQFVAPSYIVHRTKSLYPQFNIEVWLMKCKHFAKECLASLNAWHLLRKIGILAATFPSQMKATFYIFIFPSSKTNIEVWLSLVERYVRVSITTLGVEFSRRAENP